MTTDPRWVVSDSIKLALTFQLFIIAVLQLRAPSNNKVKRTLHQLAAPSIGVTLVWLANLHGLSGFGWQFFLFCSTFIVFLGSVGACYVCYVITKAQYISAQLRSSLPKRFGAPFVLVGTLCAISQTLGAILTCVTDNYHWSVFRHLATSFMCIFAGGFDFYFIIKLKRMLSEIRPSNQEASSQPDSLARTQERLTRILCILGPITVLGIISCVTLVRSTLTQSQSYSDLVEDDNEHYTVTKDIFQFWSILMFEAFFMYYAWVPLDIPNLFPRWSLGSLGLSWMKLSSRDLQIALKSDASSINDVGFESGTKEKDDYKDIDDDDSRVVFDSSLMRDGGGGMLRVPDEDADRDAIRKMSDASG